MNTISKSLITLTVAATLSACGSENTEEPEIHVSDETKINQEIGTDLDKIADDLDKGIRKIEKKIIESEKEVLAGKGQVINTNEPNPILVKEWEERNKKEKQDKIREVLGGRGQLPNTSKPNPELVKEWEEKRKREAIETFVYDNEFQADYDITVTGSDIVSDAIFNQLRIAYHDGSDLIYNFESNLFGFDIRADRAGNILYLGSGADMLNVSQHGSVSLFTESYDVTETSFEYCQIASRACTDSEMTKFTVKDLFTNHILEKEVTVLGEKITLNNLKLNWADITKESHNGKYRVAFIYMWNPEYGIVDAKGEVYTSDKKHYDNGTVEYVNDKKYEFEIKNPSYSAIQ